MTLHDLASLGGADFLRSTGDVGFRIAPHGRVLWEFADYGDRAKGHLVRVARVDGNGRTRVAYLSRDTEILLIHGRR